MNRKSFRPALAFVALGLAGCDKPGSVAEMAPPPDGTIDASAALARLKAGNDRYRNARDLRVIAVDARRAKVAKGQHPSAIVITCSDSRVPPELIFNTTLGELFVVRTAGEVAGDLELGSIEYAVEHLGAKLIVVLGHTSCGAVSAAYSGEHPEGHIHNLMDAIHPAIEAVKNAPGDKQLAAVDENARMIARHLRESRPLKEELEKHHGAVMAARYDLATGEVVWL